VKFDGKLECEFGEWLGSGMSGFQIAEEAGTEDSDVANKRVRIGVRNGKTSKGEIPTDFYPFKYHLQCCPKCYTLTLKFCEKEYGLGDWLRFLGGGTL